jgi:CMP-N-acetylneuraminic acid synthetase
MAPYKGGTMNNPPNVLAVVCARAGSKRLPGKNLEFLGDLRLVEFAFQAANDSGFITHRCVSTDCGRTAEIAARWGFETVVRPPELASDTADISDAVKHALTFYPNMDYVVTLQAAVPLRPMGAIDTLIDAVIREKALGGLTGVPVPPWLWRVGSKSPTWWNIDNYPRTQDLNEIFLIEINSIQVAPVFIAEAGFRWRFPLVFLELPAWANYDIDNAEDLLRARMSWECDRLVYDTPQKYKTHRQDLPYSAQCRGGYCELCPDKIRNDWFCSGRNL